MDPFGSFIKKFFKFCFDLFLAISLSGIVYLFYFALDKQYLVTDDKQTWGIILFGFPIWLSLLALRLSRLFKGTSSLWCLFTILILSISLFGIAFRLKLSRIAYTSVSPTAILLLVMTLSTLLAIYMKTKKFSKKIKSSP